MKIPYAESLIEINDIGENILSGILAEIRDIKRFDDVKEIQRLSGMKLVACSSGKHKSQFKIRHIRQTMRMFLNKNTSKPQKLISKT